MESAIRDFMLEIISKVVFAQLYLVSGISLCTVLLLVWRRIQRSLLAQLNEQFSELIVDELTDLNQFSLETTRLKLPAWYEPFKRYALREAVISHILAVSGPERRHLIQAYCRLGFANQDQELCYSTRWWRRLEGISHLSHLELPGAAPIFFALRRDRNDLVATSAVLALSQLRHELNSADVLKDLRAGAIHTRELLLQIVTNWARIQGHDFLLECLRKETRPEFVTVFVAVLAELHQVEAGTGLAEWLENDAFVHPPETIAYTLQSLKQIGDPSHLDVATKYLAHPEPTIRAEALDMILRVSDSIEILDLKSLRSDPAIAVQRVWHHHSDKKAA